MRSKKLSQPKLFNLGNAPVLAYEEENPQA
jgi:hypothetical protein